MFGIQWDLVCKFLEETGSKTIDEISKDSSEWGNYMNSSFEYNNGLNKEAETQTRCNTGASKRNLNESEFTLERNGNYCVLRGGAYQKNGNEEPMAIRTKGNITDNFADFGFRVTLFKTPATTAISND